MQDYEAGEVCLERHPFSLPAFFSWRLNALSYKLHLSRTLRSLSIGDLSLKLVYYNPGLKL